MTRQAGFDDGLTRSSLQRYGQKKLHRAPMEFLLRVRTNRGLRRLQASELRAGQRLHRMALLRTVGARCIGNSEPHDLGHRRYLRDLALGSDSLWHETVATIDRSMGPR